MIKITKFLIAILAFVCFTKQSFAAVSLSIKNEEIPKTKVLFLGFDSEDQRLKSDIFDIVEHIRGNLRTTDLFDIVKQSGALDMVAKNPAAKVNNAPEPQVSTSSDYLPDFEKYSKAGIGAILIGQFSYDKSGNIEARIRMWDVLDQRQLFGKFYSASKDKYHKMANIISNEIFKAITGEKVGHFDSQILYISESGSLTKRTKQVSIINFDGDANRNLTNGRDLVLTPIFSKTPDEIFYLRYFMNNPQIYSMNLRNLRSVKVGGFKGTTYAAAVNPLSSNIILLSAIIDGNSDIYEMNISANIAKRLTKNPAIDTTPSYSPDGKQIAFSSDREGSQQIYVMDADGSSVVRISKSAGSYSKPVWSPDGKLLAFTKIKSNQFYIGVMSPSGRGEKILTSGYLVEGAKWSPNGRYLVYSKKREAYGRNSIPRLFVVDIISGFEFELPTPEGEGATDPDWM